MPDEVVDPGGNVEESPSSEPSPEASSQEEPAAAPAAPQPREEMIPRGRFDQVNERMIRAEETARQQANLIQNLATRLQTPKDGPDADLERVRTPFVAGAQDENQADQVFNQVLEVSNYAAKKQSEAVKNEILQGVTQIVQQAIGGVEAKLSAPRQVEASLRGMVADGRLSPEHAALVQQNVDEALAQYPEWSKQTGLLLTSKLGELSIGGKIIVRQPGTPRPQTPPLRGQGAPAPQRDTRASREDADLAEIKRNFRGTFGRMSTADMKKHMVPIAEDDDVKVTVRGRDGSARQMPASVVRGSYEHRRDNG